MFALNTMQILCFKTEHNLYKFLFLVSMNW